PLDDVSAVLVEDLDAIVVAVADEQTTARVHRQRVRLIELVRPGALLPPAFDQLAVLRELEDLRLALAVSLRDEDLAGRPNQDVVRLKEIMVASGPAGLPERHQDPAVRTELEHLMTFRGSWQRSRRHRSATGATAALGTRGVVLIVGDPDVTVAIDEDAV